jgi:hypothetical protein
MKPLQSRHGNWQMHHAELYEALGLNPKAHLPYNGQEMTSVNGVKVYIIAKDLADDIAKHGGKRFVQRVYAVCPKCNGHIAAGNMYQHWKIHQEPAGQSLDPRDPDYSREGIFVYHNCYRCDSGAKPCVRGNTNQCEYPHARND